MQKRCAPQSASVRHSSYTQEDTHDPGVPPHSDVQTPPSFALQSKSLWHSQGLCCLSQRPLGPERRSRTISWGVPSGSTQRWRVSSERSGADAEGSGAGPERGVADPEHPAQKAAPSKRRQDAAPRWAQRSPSSWMHRVVSMTAKVSPRVVRQQPQTGRRLTTPNRRRAPALRARPSAAGIW
jgi:hypothetical protein